MEGSSLYEKQRELQAGPEKLEIHKEAEGVFQWAVFAAVIFALQYHMGLQHKCTV